MRQLLAISSLLLAGSAGAQSAVQVAPVVVQDVRLGRRVVATVQPIRTSTIGSALDGRVLIFDVNAGDKVEEGQRLAQLRPDTLKLQLAAAKAQLELNQQQLAELENGSRPEEIAEAEALMLAAKAASDNALKKLERLTTLVQSRAASDSELEDAREQADARRFIRMAAEATLKRIQVGPRAEAIAQAQAQVDLQKQQVRLLKDQINKLSIKAPFDGFVTAEFTEVGSWISQGDPIAQVTQLDVVEIVVPATAEIVVNVEPGDSVRVEFPELPEKLFVGEVERVVPMADSRSRTFPIYVRMDNAFNEQGNPVLKAGMLARVDLPSGSREAMPLVPKDALVLNGQQRSVFVVDPVSETDASTEIESNEDMGVAREVPVILGVAVGGLIQVAGDLDDGDRVVVVGNERLLPGASVRVIPTRESAIETPGSPE